MLMPFRLGSTEVLVVLVLVVLLFGVGRVGRIGAELGKGIRSFRDGLSGRDDIEQEVDRR